MRLSPTQDGKYKLSVQASWSSGAIEQHGDAGGTRAHVDNNASPVSKLWAPNGSKLTHLKTGADGRPAGCPRSFCGCGAAIRLFGRIVPELNLAANWLRFPRASPAPGMVAARRGHVFVLEQHLGGDMWMAYDANSGGHATRIHARSLRGYAVVNPHTT